jgi:hypothetical protein
MAAGKGETFLFTSESVGEGHPGERVPDISLSILSVCEHDFMLLILSLGLHDYIFAGSTSCIAAHPLLHYYLLLGHGMYM